MKRVLVFVALMLGSTAALADPVSYIANAIFYLIEATGLNAVISIGYTFVYAVSYGIVIAAGVSMANRARRRARDAANASLRDRTVTVRGSVEPRRMVLGRQPVGGVVAFHGSVGANKEMFVMVIALAAHECHSIDDIYFNDVKVELGGTDNEYVQTAPYAITSNESKVEITYNTSSITLTQTPIAGSVSAVYDTLGENGSVTLGIISVVGNVVTFESAPPYNIYVHYQTSVLTPYARVRKFLGAPGQTVDAVVNSLFPDQWDSTHPLSGCAGLALFFTYSEEAYVSGLPNVMAVVKGAKVYDVRKDTTAGGSGTHRVNDPTTWEWSESPPLLIRHYALHALGGRLPAGSVNETYVASAAEVCDTLVNYSDWAGLVNENGFLIVTENGDVILAGSTGEEEDPLYTAGLVATTDQRPLDVISELAEAMAGKVAFIGNQLIVKAGQYVAPVIYLDDNDFAKPGVVVQAKRPREDLFNEVTATILDDANDWAVVSIPRVTSSAYVTEDGTKLPVTFEYKAIHRVGQAQQVSAVALRQARQALTFTATFKLKALQLQILDTFYLTNARRGWTNKPFEVIGRRWSIDGMVEITGQETDPSIFGFGNTFDSVDVAPNTNLTLPHNIAQLTGLAIESGTTELSDGSIITRVKITWTPSTDQSVIQNGVVQVQYLDAAVVIQPEDWPAQSVPGGASEMVIVGPQGGRVYVFRARFIGASGRVRGPWSAQIQHTIATPPSISSQNLLINPSFELDTANVPNNWSTESAGTTGTVSHSDATGVFGARAQRIDCTNLGTALTDYAGYVQGVNVSGFVNKQLTLSIYALGTSSAKLYLYVEWRASPGGSVVSTSFATHTLSGTVTRYADTFLCPSGALHADVHVRLAQRSTAGAAFMESDAAQFEPGSSATAFTASADEALAVANAAAATASAAASDAAAAITQLNNIASDNVLTPDEKPAAVLDYNILTGEQAGIDAQAVAFSITTEKTNYDNAIAALTAYLATLSGWNTIPGSNVVIVGTTWRSNWSAAYLTRQVLLNRIYTEAALRASWTTVSGRPSVFRASAKGYSAAAAGNGPSGIGLFNAETGGQLVTVARSYTLIRIRRSDKAITFNQTYDVYLSSANADSMATAMNATDHTSVVVVITHDEPMNNRLTTSLKAAMLRCGASVGVFGSPQFKSRSAYILIGIGGCGEGNGAEFYQGAVDDDPQAWTDASFMVTADGSLLVTGSSAIPRTLTDYGAGGLAYLGSVDTSQINPGAATATGFQQSASGTVSANIGGDNTSFAINRQNICQLDYTNSLGEAVPIQFEGSIAIWETLQGTGTANGTAKLVLWTTNGEAPDVSGPTLNITPSDSSSANPKVLSSSLQYTVPAGGTVHIGFRVQSSIASAPFSFNGSTFDWVDASTRYAVIKR